MQERSARIPFHLFEELYMTYLTAGDRPTCYVAYIRAEADMVQQFGCKRHSSYVSFRNILCRQRRRRRQLKLKHKQQ